MEAPVMPPHLAPQLDSPPLSPRISAFRGSEDKLGTPSTPGSPLPDPGSVQRLALRLNERIASEERSHGTTPRRSLSPSPLKLAKEYERQLQRAQSPDSPDRSAPRSPSPLKKDSRIADALAAFQDTPKGKPSCRSSMPFLGRAKSGVTPSPAGKTDIVPLTMSPKLATRFAVKGDAQRSTPTGSPELQSRRRSNRLSASMPEAFAALREIEDAMRIIEKAESPLGSHSHRTFNNTFWEPGPREGVEEASTSAVARPLEGRPVMPKEATPVKHIAKELFPAGVEEHAKSPDVGHILAGNQVKLPADIAAPGSRNRLPLLEHPIEELTTPKKPGTPAEAGDDEWEFPQTPGSLKGPASAKLWGSPAVDPAIMPLPPSQPAGRAVSCGATAGQELAVRRAASAKQIVITILVVASLLTGLGLLALHNLPWLMHHMTMHSGQQLLTGHDLLSVPAPAMQNESNALAVIPAHRFKRHHWALTNMAARVINTVRDGFPIPAALQTLTHSPAATLARASADGAVEAGAKQQHQLAHVPFAAMLAAEALAVYCLTRLTLSLMVWRCGNPCCARRGKLKRRHISGCTMCWRCAQWATRHGGQFWGTWAAQHPAWARLPGGRAGMCLLRDMGLGFARED